MTRIIVASKEGLDVLQEGQLNDVGLDQPTSIQIGVSQKNIAPMQRIQQSIHSFFQLNKENLLKHNLMLKVRL